MTEKDAVLFDLDDTLCEHEVTVDDVLEDAFDEVGVEPFFDAEDFRRWVPRVNAERPLDLREKCFSSIAEEKGRNEEVAYKLAEAFDEPDPTDVKMVPGAAEVLEKTSERYRLGLVTNGGAETQKKKLESLEISSYFESKIFATPENAVKPDPEPFYSALHSLGLEGEEVIHIGNSFESDIAGARNAGIESVWIKSRAHRTEFEGEVKPDYSVSTVADLKHNFPWEGE